MSEAPTFGSRPRDRILETARKLFRRCGIRGAGVEAIAESAGTNKMTLYRHFHSKDDLIVACLRQAATDAQAAWSEIEASFPDNPCARLDAWVDVVDATIRQGRHCEVANAAIELPEAPEVVRTTIAEYKAAQRQRLVQLCAAAGIKRSEALADMLWLLIEGARVVRQAVGENSASRSFAECARAAIAAFEAEAAMSGLMPPSPARTKSLQGTSPGQQSKEN